jgi:hypothetical protein
MAETFPNVFDLVAPPRVEPEIEEQPKQARRVCTYRSRLGTPCTRDAEDDALTCNLHGKGKTSLTALRKEAINLGPLVMEALEDMITDDSNQIARIQAVKMWHEITGMKDLPAVGAAIEEEELNAARVSLSHKLERVTKLLLERKTA